MAEIAASIDCTTGLSDVDDVVLFMPVELTAVVVFDILEFVVRLRTFIWAYETIPFENGHMKRYHLRI
jgi:hypothetical protein